MAGKTSKKSAKVAKNASGERVVLGIAPDTILTDRMSRPVRLTDGRPILRLLGTTSRFCMVGLALGLFLSLYQHGGAGDKKTDLQGTWAIVSSEFAGAPQKRDIGGKLIFDGGKFTFKEKLKDSPGRFVLDTRTKPKQFDFVLDDNKNVFGIYDLDGDTLKLCFVKGGEKGSRPTAFVSKKDTNIVLLVLKREKK
jgi:uncharacterized protein (TIGR03067 family)